MSMLMSKALCLAHFRQVIGVSKVITTFTEDHLSIRCKTEGSIDEQNNLDEERVPLHTV